MKRPLCISGRFSFQNIIKFDRDFMGNNRTAFALRKLCYCFVLFFFKENVLPRS